MLAQNFANVFFFFVSFSPSQKVERVVTMVKKTFYSTLFQKLGLFCQNGLFILTNYHFTGKIKGKNYFYRI